MKAAVIKNNAKSIDNIGILLAGYGVDHTVIGHADAGPDLEREYDFSVLSGGRLDFREPVFDGERELIEKAEKPLFAICMGFQLVCDVFGVHLDVMPEKYEGLQDIRVYDLPKLGIDRPDGTLTVHQNHRCVVPRCPVGFTQYAVSPNGVEMIVHNSRPLWATQFHPEYTENNNGHIVLDTFISGVNRYTT